MIEVAFLDVGNADSIVITTSAQSGIVVDVGKPRQTEDWLTQRGCKHIEGLFFTHKHQDHTPSLDKLVTFLDGWLETRTIGKIYLPTDYIRLAINTPRMQHSFAKLSLLDGKISRAETSNSPIELGSMGILHILHPSFLFVEQNSSSNALSLILRLEYGCFSALLLADIEGAGLKALLNKSSADCLKCNVLKVPHHGAWQSENEVMVQDLFDRADAEFVVLSVGSTNPYGHVVPHLFVELFKRKNDTDKRLKQFVCTEVTRTCVFARDERENMGKRGLEQKRPCGGDVVIRATQDGNWLFANEIEHNQVLQTIERPACFGQADL